MLTTKTAIHPYLQSFKSTALIPSEEQAILKKLSEGNQAAFWQLWILYQDYLYGHCIRWMGGNSTEAEEALSAARLKAWEKMPRYAQTITNPKAWLTRLTHNLCIDLHRERNRSAKGLESLDKISFDEQEILSNHTNSPEFLMLQRETNQSIRRAVKHLPAKLQKPFILRFYREMPYIAIAQTLGISPENARKRIQQARTILKKQLINCR